MSPAGGAEGRPHAASVSPYCLSLPLPQPSHCTVLPVPSHCTVLHCSCRAAQVVPQEERMLKEAFGDKYEEYT